jgi:hypothetical protein
MAQPERPETAADFIETAPVNWSPSVRCIVAVIAPI